MRLFGYYAWHSFVNQLRKLFKTWVLIFLVICMAVGALIGVGAAMLDDASGEDEEIVESEITGGNRRTCRGRDYSCSLCLSSNQC